jgi:raffinose/stachyose/melibiose transport system substrate-binding protein
MTSVKGLVALGLAASALVLGACGSGGDQSTTAGGASSSTAAAKSAGEDLSGSLRVGWIAEVRAGMEPIAAAFKKKYPNVDLKVEYTPLPQFIQTLSTQIRAGNAPDVIYTGSGSSIPIGPVPLGNAGRLAALSGLPAAADLPKPIRVNVSASDGKVVALSPSLNVDGLIYNSDMLQKAGIEPPKRFDELLAACKKLSDAGTTPIAFSSDPPLLQSVLSQLGAAFVTSQDPDWATKRAAGNTTFAGSPEWQRALHAFEQMRDAKCFSQGAQGTTSAQVINQLANGQAAMFINGTSYIGAVAGLNPETGAKLRLTPMPNDAGDGKVTLVAASAMGVNADADNAAAAKKFVEFAVSPDVAAQSAKVQGGVTLKQMADGDVPASMSDIKADLQDGNYFPTTSTGWPPTVSTQAATQLIGLFTGQANAKAVLAAADKAWDSNS